ncbi:hypothetical protein ACMFMG_001807 [Clarireedia jacksonii]
MQRLIDAIHTTPIIDHHAHPILKPSARAKYVFKSITTEAVGAAMEATGCSLAHLRACNQLAKVLHCSLSWNDVTKAIEEQTTRLENTWSKRCLQGIEIILLDDGLSISDEVFDSAGHDKCKRILRIEMVAAKILNDHLERFENFGAKIFEQVLDEFEDTIQKAINDPEIVGFKLVIAYRTGLNVLRTSPVEELKASFLHIIRTQRANNLTRFERLEKASNTKDKKPIQFHTGLCDNDVNLVRSSPSHLQEFIRAFPQVPIVLLHASYPWTKEAGFLATVFVKHSKRCSWTMFAVALLTFHAVKIVEDIFFNTSNKLYDLKLEMIPFERDVAYQSAGSCATAGDLEIVRRLMEAHLEIKFLRIQFIDYTATTRLRIVPITRVLNLLEQGLHVSIGLSSSSLTLMQNNQLITGILPSGEYRLSPVFTSLRPGPSRRYISAPGELQIMDHPSLTACPRRLLREIVDRAHDLDLDFLVGLEIEIVFMKEVRGHFDSEVVCFKPLPGMASHCWSSARPLEDENITDAIEEIFDTFSVAGINIEQWHPESATGQYEFVLPPLPPVEAVDTLIQAREIIATVSRKHGWRATLHPSPVPGMVGTGAHAHLSISSHNSEHVYNNFYAGFLKSLRSIIAFAYSSTDSYSRVFGPGCESAGQSWVSWGTQDKTTPLRKIASSHWEIKALDDLANSYLVLAAIIAAGTEGVRKREVLIWGDCTSKDPSQISKEDRDKLNVTEKLPGSLSEALAVLEADKEMYEMLGEIVVKTYLATKQAEMRILKPMNEEQRRNWLIERY